jgi:hypothetical protein
MKNPETEEIDKDINKLLDLLNSTKYPDFKPPRGISVKDYKKDLEKQIRFLNNKRRYNIIAKHEITPREFDKELKMGIEDESGEHKGDILKSTDIALDHLSKNPRYYTKLKKMEESLSFSDYYNLVLALEQETLGLVEPIKIEGIDAELVALIDSGNAAYNVLHGVDIEDRGSEVEFITTNNVRVVKPKVDEITIHVGAGHDEHRPVVEFTIEIGSKVYPDVKFSIGDRTENQHPVLIGADFLKQVNALIDVSKE